MATRSLIDRINEDRIDENEEGDFDLVKYPAWAEKSPKEQIVTDVEIKVIKPIEFIDISVILDDKTEKGN